MRTESGSNATDSHPTARLVLTSSSPYRRALLERLGVPFTWQAPEVDERPRPDESPHHLVRRLALTKARALASHFPSSLLIGSDQVAAIDGTLRGKPGSREHAIAQLTAASGRSVRFLTSVCVLDSSYARYELEVVPCEVRFRHLRAAQIAQYIDREQPLDCAGSFRCEGLGIALFEAIDGEDTTALIGLPLIALVGMLTRAGLDVLAPACLP